MEVLDASEEIMGRCFPLYLTNLVAMWFKQLKNGSISTWTDLVNRFLRQFRVHISQPKNVFTLSNVKQRPVESLRSYLTRFNATVAVMDKPDPSFILIAAVFRVANKTDFKAVLKRDPSMDLAEFYYGAEMYLHQEDVEVEDEDVDAEINAVEGGGLSGAGNGKDKGKRKADDNIKGPK